MGKFQPRPGWLYGAMPRGGRSRQDRRRVDGGGWAGARALSGWCDYRLLNDPGPLGLPPRGTGMAADGCSGWSHPHRFADTAPSRRRHVLARSVKIL